MGDNGDPRLFTGNTETLQTRVCSRQCATCIFGNNSIYYTKDSTDRLEAEALADDNVIPCHSTYPPLGIGPAAVCRGFFNRNRKVSKRIKLMQIFGIEQIDPPAKPKNPDWPGVYDSDV